METNTLKHSGLGIASFVISMVSVMLFLVLAVMFAILVASIAGDFSVDAPPTPEYILESAPGLIIVGLLFMLVALLSLVGGILGIVGLVQKDRKKVFPILGTVFNFSGWVIFIFLFIIGTLLQ